jgi:hypothetical protein
MLHNGRHIRVDLNLDPCWNECDIWMARNLYVRFRLQNYTHEDASSYASMAVWKQKWNRTQYNKSQELALHTIPFSSQNSIS